MTGNKPARVDVIESIDAWASTFETGWRAHLRDRGEWDWDQYSEVRNKVRPGGPGVSLGSSRLLLVSSAGAYLPAEQEPFDAANREGDYSLRTFPSNTSFSSLDYAHDHYEHDWIRRDPQIGLPLRSLEVLVEEGRIGSLAESVVSFMGFQPDARRVVLELAPQVVAAAKRMHADAALLAPV